MIYNLVKKKMVVRLEDTRDDVGLHPARVLGPRVSKLLAISLVDLQTPEHQHEGGDNREVVGHQLGKAESGSGRENP